MAIEQRGRRVACLWCSGMLWLTLPSNAAAALNTSAVRQCSLRDDHSMLDCPSKLHCGSNSYSGMNDLESNYRYTRERREFSKTPFQVLKMSDQILKLHAGFIIDDGGIKGYFWYF